MSAEKIVRELAEIQEISLLADYEAAVARIIEQAVLWCESNPE